MAVASGTVKLRMPLCCVCVCVDTLLALWGVCMCMCVCLCGHCWPAFLAGLWWSVGSLAPDPGGWHVAWTPRVEACGWLLHVGAGGVGSRRA